MKKNHIISLLVIILLVCILLFLYRMPVGKVAYFEQLGIFKLMQSDEKALNEEVVDNFLYKYYDGITLVYLDENFLRAEITTSEHKLEKGISVGSDKGFVKFVYAKTTKIQGLSENEYGFVNEAQEYVCFKFDEQDKVEKIVISIGP